MNTKELIILFSLILSWFYIALGTGEQRRGFKKAVRWMWRCPMTDILKGTSSSKVNGLNEQDNYRWDYYGIVIASSLCVMTSVEAVQMSLFKLVQTFSSIRVEECRVNIPFGPKSPTCLQYFA